MPAAMARLAYETGDRAGWLCALPACVDWEKNDREGEKKKIERK